MVSAWLADRHAKDQETIADNLAVAFFPLWQIMRFNDLDASSARFAEAAVPIVETSFLQSQRLATAFNANVRFVDLVFEIPLLFDVPDVQRPTGVGVDSFRVPDLRVGGAEQRTVPLQQFDRADVVKTLVIESNYMTKRAMPGPEEEIMRAASVRTAGAAIRESLNGGRGVTDRVLRTDRRVKGFARVTDSNPCPLCAVLAARGAVYSKGSFINSDKEYLPHPDGARDTPEGWTNVAKVHDNCRCQLRPVYTTLDGMDAAAKHYKYLWDEFVKNRRGTRKQRFNWFAEKVKENPFDGNQFDLNLMQRELQDRTDGLLDAGLSPSDPRVRFASSMRRQIASAA